MLLLIAGHDWEQNPTANLCSRYTAKIQKVKQRVAAVACFTQHVEVIWVQTDRTRHMPSFLGKKGAGNGSLETGIQVDLSDQCLAAEWISVPTRGNQTLSQRRGTWTRCKGRVRLKRLVADVTVEVSCAIDLEIITLLATLLLETVFHFHFYLYTKAYKLDCLCNTW